MTTKPWMTAEIRFLRDNASRFTVKQMANLLDRSYHSVYYQLQQHNIPVRKRAYRQWTAPEIRCLLTMRANGASYSTIGNKLGRS